MRSWTIRHRIGRKSWYRVHIAEVRGLYVASLTDHPHVSAANTTLLAAFADLIRRVRPRLFELNQRNHSASG